MKILVTSFSGLLALVNEMTSLETTISGTS